jgi:hypothetical protein
MFIHKLIIALVPNHYKCPINTGGSIALDKCSKKVYTFFKGVTVGKTVIWQGDRLRRQI